MDLIKKKYQIQGEGPSDYYLEKDYKTYKGQYAVRFNKCIKEALRRVQGKEKDKIKRQSVPASPRDHPELETSKFLDYDGHLY